MGHSTLKPFEVEYNLCLAFFDSLLDKSFTIFKLTGGEEDHPFKHFNSSKLLPVLTQRCPNLKSLDLHFRKDALVPGMVPHVCTSLESFKGLTSLSLSLFYSRHKLGLLPFFTSLGNCCPKLISLDLSGLQFTSSHLLPLVLGKKYKLLPQQLHIYSGLKTLQWLMSNSLANLSLRCAQPFNN